MSAATAAKQVAAVLAACGLVTGMVVNSEGWLLIGHKDPIGKVSECAGSTKEAVYKVARSEEYCAKALADDLVEHGMGIAPCLPEALPIETRGAFISFAYNVGVPKFCASTLAQKARAGDLRGACAELSRWVNAGGKPWPGLVKRRATERALCEKGLAR